MPVGNEKSTSVRALNAAMAGLERFAPSLGARWVDRLWFGVPARRPNGNLPAAGTPFELSVAGRTVRGRRWGHGEEIVYLVHGWGSSSTQMRAFVEPLRAADFTVVVHDALSHGRSDTGPSGPRRSNALEHAEALRAVVAANGPAHGVVAHSLGAMVAALVMRDGIVPERAVYLAPMIDVTSYGEPFMRMLGAGPRIWSRFIDRTERRLGVRMSYFDIAAIVDELATPPLLIVHDRHDQETSWQASRNLMSSWPETQLLTTTGLGHNRILADPQVVASAVDFLRGTDISRENLEAAALAKPAE
jgi:pimeloyl-ACP methyl ester carboxylesterase